MPDSYKFAAPWFRLSINRRSLSAMNSELDSTLWRICCRRISLTSPGEVHSLSLTSPPECVAAFSPHLAAAYGREGKNQPLRGARHLHPRLSLSSVVIIYQVVLCCLLPSTGKKRESGGFKVPTAPWRDMNYSHTSSSRIYSPQPARNNKLSRGATNILLAAADSWLSIKWNQQFPQDNLRWRPPARETHFRVTIALKAQTQTPEIGSGNLQILCFSI